MLQILDCNSLIEDPEKKLLNLIIAKKISFFRNKLYKVF